MKVIPSLSEDGWVSSPLKMIDYIVSHYFTTDYRQSYLYAGSIISLSLSFHKGSNDIELMKNYITEDLSNLLNRYFEYAEVTVKLKKDLKIDTHYHISISSKITGLDLKTYDMYHVVSSENFIAFKIIRYNNYGDSYNAYSGIN